MVHCHVHTYANRIIGLTRIVCNQRGHVDEHTGFAAACVIHVT